MVDKIAEIFNLQFGGEAIYLNILVWGRSRAGKTQCLETLTGQDWKAPESTKIPCVFTARTVHKNVVVRFFDLPGMNDGDGLDEYHLRNIERKVLHLGEGATAEGGGGEKFHLVLLFTDAVDRGIDTIHLFDKFNRILKHQNLWEKTIICFSKTKDIQEPSPNDLAQLQDYIAKKSYSEMVANSIRVALMADYGVEKAYRLPAVNVPSGSNVVPWFRRYVSRILVTLSEQKLSHAFLSILEDANKTQWTVRPINVSTETQLNKVQNDRIGKQRQSIILTATARWVQTFSNTVDNFTRAVQ